MSDMDTLARNLRVLLKADLILAELAMRRLATRSVLFIFAGVVAAFGAVMLGLAGFFLLQEAYGTIAAAAISGAVALVLALLLALVAASVKPGREDQVAKEVHEVAFQAVTVDLRLAGLQAQRFAAMVRSPMDSLVPSLVVPLFGFLLKWLRGRGGGGS